MTSDQNLALYTKLCGFRLVVLANRFGCDNDVSRKLHERLLEGLDIDFDTHEYRINGGDWCIALTADYTGVDIDYPELVALTDDELGSLAPIIKEITRETGIAVNASRVSYIRCTGS